MHILLLLSERTPLERCCVHNMSPFVSSSGLSPGSCEAAPSSASIAWSQVWLGLPAGRLQSGGTRRIHAARARRWSSRGELRAHCAILTGLSIASGKPRLLRPRWYVMVWKRCLEDRELNQARSKPDTVDQPVRTARIFGMVWSALDIQH